jgi:glutaminyl-peptide cyclotransferase
MFADQDPDPVERGNYVPGANDGASGVAVLLGLARSLPMDSVPVGLVFFEAEDNVNIEGWDWIPGAPEFVGIIRFNHMQPSSWIGLVTQI